MAPPPFGTVYTFNDNGTIQAVPEGIMTPDGVRLVAGSPASVPPARPAALAAAAAAAAVTAPVPADPALAATPEAVVDPTTVVGADPALADARPRARPADLAPAPASDDDAALPADGETRLASSPRPLPRPASLTAAATPAPQLRDSDAASLAAASAAAGSAAEAIIQDLATVTAETAQPAVTPSGSRLAVSVSRIPAPRPRDMERAVAAALEAATRAPEPEPEPEPEQVAAAAPTPEAEPEPELEAPVAAAPTSGSVADRATFVNALNLSRINLIGIYGTQSNRYALIRQANGRYKQVSVGDRIDGGTVAAITASEVRYQKGGRLIALQMPDT
jgi:type IV pilus biogenesis protein PilP